jgi:integrase
LGNGLTVCLEPSGAKTFQARIRRQGEPNARRIRIGSFPALSVAEARRKFSEYKSIAREGRDPALEQRRAKANVKQPRTFTALVEVYLERRVGLIASKTHRLEADLLRTVLMPHLGDRLLSDLDPSDFGTVLGRYSARLREEGRSAGTNANKALAVARRVFKLTRGWGVYGGSDPTAGLTRPAKESPRDRVLYDGTVLISSDASVNELGRLVAALNADPRPIQISDSTRAALLLTLMFGLRALEACSLEWRAITLDRDSPSLTITTSKTKAGLRTLPLTAAAALVLKEQRARSARDSIFVFPASEGSRRTSHLHPESLSRAFSRACTSLAIDGAVLHDLRRTALSGMIELGHGAVAERIAGHTATSVLGKHYDRSDRHAAMKAALTDWCEAIVSAERAFISGRSQ